MNNRENTINYRHNDSPQLWMSVFLFSISLHLLGFLFLKSLNTFRPWIPPSSQDVIAIDLIDIPSPVKTTPSFSTAKSIPQTSPQTTVNQPKKTDVQDLKTEDNLSLNNQNNEIDTNNLTLQSQPQTKSTPQIKPELKVTPQSQIIPKTTPTPTIPLNDLPWNRRQEIELGKGTPLPNDFSSNSPTPTPTPTPESSPTPTPTPTPESSPTPTPTPTPESSPTPTPESSPSVKQIGILASILPLARDEVEKLRQDGEIRIDAPPDVLAEYQGSRSKELEINVIPGEEELQPANILASLIINKNGQFVDVFIVNIQKTTPTTEKENQIYKNIVKDIFKQEIFLPGYNQDGSKPELSNLYVRLKIEPKNSQF